MPLEAGDEECNSGLAQKLHDAWIEPIKEGSLDGMGASDENIIPKIDETTGEKTGEDIEKTDNAKRFCYNLSRVLIDYIKNNMVVHGVEITINKQEIKEFIDTALPEETITFTQSNEGSVE